MITLNNAKRGIIYKIIGFETPFDDISRRFSELGFTRGQSVKIVATSLQKKVFLVEIRGYLLSVRAALLSRVQVE